MPLEERRFISENLTHSFFDSDYSDFFTDKSTEIGGYSINPNLFRSTGPETLTETPNGEFKYEFFYEVPPTKEVYRAFFLNIQFLGNLPKFEPNPKTLFLGHDNMGWLELTSELQFADEEYDAFPDCHGADCKGELV